MFLLQLLVTRLISFSHFSIACNSLPVLLGQIPIRIVERNGIGNLRVCTYIVCVCAHVYNKSSCYQGTVNLVENVAYYVQNFDQIRYTVREGGGKERERERERGGDREEVPFMQ